MAGRNKGQRIAFVASDRPRGQAALKELVKMYGNCAPDDAEVIVALGGDGTLLDVLRAHMHHDIPVYGMNCGTVGETEINAHSFGLADADRDRTPWNYPTQRC